MAKQKSKWRQRNQKNPPWTPFVQVDANRDYGGMLFEKVLVNSRYTVLVRGIGNGMEHLSIKRNDKDWMHDWRELQRVKNEVVGPEREAVEIYPAESRLVDTSNQYHLWVLPEGATTGFGFQERALVEGHEGGLGRSRQRDFEENPEDTLSTQEAADVVAQMLEALEGRR